MKRTLASFRAKEPDPTPWVPPTRADLAYGHVLAVDQSLSALGWAQVTSDADGVRVVATGSVVHKPEDFPRGHEGTLAKGMALSRALREVWGGLDDPPEGLAFVHETPPVGSRMARPESSLVSAMVVRLVVDELFHDVVFTVANQHSKTVMTGSPKATKREWHAGIPHFDLGPGAKPRNEGERDAVCLAITWFYDLYQKEKG